MVEKKCSAKKANGENCGAKIGGAFQNTKFCGKHQNNGTQSPALSVFDFKTEVDPEISPEEAFSDFMEEFETWSDGMQEMESTGSKVFVQIGYQTATENWIEGEKVGFNSFAEAAEAFSENFGSLEQETNAEGCAIAFDIRDEETGQFILIDSTAASYSNRSKGLWQANNWSLSDNEDDDDEIANAFFAKYNL